MLIECAFRGKHEPKESISQPGHHTVLCHVTKTANYIFPFVLVQLVFGLTDASWIVLISNGPGTYRSPQIKSQVRMLP